MPRAAQRFKQRDVTRGLRAAERAGVQVQRVEIGSDGKIVLVIGDTDEPGAARDGGSDNGSDREAEAA